MIGCRKGEETLAATSFVGSNDPSVHKGTSAAHPGFVEYDRGHGPETCEGGNCLFPNTEGELKILGYEEQEVINVK